MAGQWQPGMAWADADSDDEQPQPMKSKVAPPGKHQQVSTSMGMAGQQNQQQNQNQQGQQMMQPGQPMMMMMPMGMQQGQQMMMPMGMQQGQQMMMPMGMGMGQQMMMPMAMSGQQGQQMPMMMMMMPNGQPQMMQGQPQMMQGQPQMMQQCQPQQMQQPVAWAGQQMSQPAPTNDTGGTSAKTETSGSPKAPKKETMKAKLKNGKLGGNSNNLDQTKVEQPKVEQPKTEVKSEEKDTKLRHELMQRQASEVVQRLRQAGARRAGLGDTAAQLRHSTFSALNLEVSSSSRRGAALQPLRRQSLAELQREFKAARESQKSEKSTDLSLPSGNWSKGKIECVSSPSASTRASGEEADVDGLAEFDNLVAA